MSDRADQAEVIESIAARPMVATERLHSVDWIAHGGPYLALDYAFTWQTNQPLLAEALRDCFDPLPRAPDHQPMVQYSAALAGNLGGAGFVFADGDRVVSVRHVEHAFRMITWHVNREAARVTSERAVVLHAAGIAKDGNVVVLSAPMESGKSTLAAGMVRAGWGYVTDEALAVSSESFEVTGYPRSLTLDKGSWPLFPELRPSGALAHPNLAYAQWHIPPDRVRKGCRTSGGHVSLVVMPRYRSGSPTTVRPLSPAELVIGLGEQTFRFKERPDRNLQALARLAESVPAFELVHGSLSEAVAAVEAIASRRGGGQR